MNNRWIPLAYLAGVLTVFSGTVVAQSANLLFPDVQPSAFFFDAVTRTAKKSIISGYQDGRFGPYDYVTRGQVAVILDRYDQKVVQNLRTQVEQLRQAANVGTCGDGTAQLGEECDDGNQLSGDGCTPQCLLEIHCAGGYKIGDRYPAADGCNVCTCTEAGIACTERACTQTKCFSSDQCGSTEICSVELGDCRFPCPQGAVCVQACAGVCLPKSVTSVCGNSVCETGESAFPGNSADVYCPQDCQIQGPVCDNKVCEPGEADEYQLGQNGPTLVRRGTCPSDCEGGLTACAQQKQAIDAIFSRNVTCETDADCTVFTRGCSPYQTCGKPIRKDALVQVTTTIIDFADECGNDEPKVCAVCLPKTARCQNNVCVAE